MPRKKNQKPKKFEAGNSVDENQSIVNYIGNEEDSDWDTESDNSKLENDEPRSELDKMIANLNSSEEDYVMNKIMDKNDPREGEQNPELANNPFLQLLSGLTNAAQDLDGNGDYFDPNSSELNNSILNVGVVTKNNSYLTPDGNRDNSYGNGSGFIVNFDGKPHIITNAHVADATQQIKLNFAKSKKKYIAKVKQIDNDCDLALLEVDNDEFWEKARPLEFIDKVELGDRVYSYGFPLSFSSQKSLSIETGTITQKETHEYTMGNAKLPVYKTSTNVNFGNSGGPIIIGGKVAGVAFQGVALVELNGYEYIIPHEVVKHFLQDALSPEPYKGFPSLALKLQKLENASLRAHYNLQDDNIGVRIAKIPPLSAAKNILKENDIILKIDGENVYNDKSVKLPGIVEDDRINIAYHYAISKKFIGDTVNFTVQRDGEILELGVKLLSRAKTQRIVNKTQEDAPQYYQVSGIKFQPLTKNYIRDLVINADDPGAFGKKESKLIALYGSKYKDKPGQQLIFINDILHHEGTEDYNEFVNKIVVEVNGVKINNIRDVITAIEGKPGLKTDKFVFDDNKIMVVPRLKQQEKRKLIENFNLKGDRSSDLKHPPKPVHGCPEAYPLSQFEIHKNKESSTVTVEQHKGSNKRKRGMG